MKAFSSSILIMALFLSNASAIQIRNKPTIQAKQQQPVQQLPICDLTTPGCPANGIREYDDHSHPTPAFAQIKKQPVQNLPVCDLTKPSCPADGQVPHADADPSHPQPVAGQFSSLVQLKEEGDPYAALAQLEGYNATKAADVEKEAELVKSVVNTNATAEVLTYLNEVDKFQKELNNDEAETPKPEAKPRNLTQITPVAQPAQSLAAVDSSSGEAVDAQQVIQNSINMYKEQQYRKEHPLGHLDELFKSISDFSQKVDQHVDNVSTHEPAELSQKSSSASHETTYEPSLIDMLEKKELDQETIEKNRNALSQQNAVQKTLDLARKQRQAQEEKEPKKPSFHFADFTESIGQLNKQFASSLGEEEDPEKDHQKVQALVNKFKQKSEEKKAQEELLRQQKELEEEKNLKAQLELLQKEYGKRKAPVNQHVPTLYEMRDNIMNLSKFLNEKENTPQNNQELAAQEMKINEFSAKQHKRQEEESISQAEKEVLEMKNEMEAEDKAQKEKEAKAEKEKEKKEIEFLNNMNTENLQKLVQAGLKELHSRHANMAQFENEISENKEKKAVAAAQKSKAEARPVETHDKQLAVAQKAVPVPQHDKQLAVAQKAQAPRPVESHDKQLAVVQKKLEAPVAKVMAPPQKEILKVVKVEAPKAAEKPVAVKVQKDANKVHEAVKTEKKVEIKAPEPKKEEHKVAIKTPEIKKAIEKVVETPKPQQAPKAAPAKAAAAPKHEEKPTKQKADGNKPRSFFARTLERNLTFDKADMTNGIEQKVSFVQKAAQPVIGQLPQMLVQKAK